MESKKSKTGYYNALVWLQLTGYNEKTTPQYLPSDYLLDSLPQDIASRSGLDLVVLDSTLYDFKLASSVKEYLDLLQNTTAKFENALVLVSYTDEQYILRDCFLAGLAKVYSCWDIAYIHCPYPEKVTSKAFDFVITPEELPEKLTKIIENDDR